MAASTGMNKVVVRGLGFPLSSLWRFGPRALFIALKLY